MGRTGAVVKPRTLGREVPGSSDTWVAVRCKLMYCGDARDLSLVVYSKTREDWSTKYVYTERYMKWSTTQHRTHTS